MSKFFLYFFVRTHVWMDCRIKSITVGRYLPRLLLLLALFIQCELCRIEIGSGG